MANAIDTTRDNLANNAKNALCSIYTITPANFIAEFVSGALGREQDYDNAFRSLCGPPQKPPIKRPPGQCGVAGQEYCLQIIFIDTGAIADNVCGYQGPVTFTTNEYGQLRVIGANGTGVRDNSNPEVFYFNLVNNDATQTPVDCASNGKNLYPELTSGQRTTINNIINENYIYGYFGGSGIRDRPGQDGSGGDGTNPNPTGGGGGGDCPSVDLFPVLAAITALGVEIGLLFGALELSLGAVATEVTAIGVAVGKIFLDTQAIKLTVGSIDTRTAEIKTKVDQIKSDIDDIEGDIKKLRDGLQFDGTASLSGRVNKTIKSVYQAVEDLIGMLGYTDANNTYPINGIDFDVSSASKAIEAGLTGLGLSRELKELGPDGLYDGEKTDVTGVLLQIRDSKEDPFLIQGWEVKKPLNNTAVLFYSSVNGSRSHDVRIQIPNVAADVKITDVPNGGRTFVRGEYYCRIQYADNSSIQGWFPSENNGEIFLSQVAALSQNEVTDESFSARRGGKNKPLSKQGSTFSLHTMYVYVPENDKVKRLVYRLD